MRWYLQGVGRPDGDSGGGCGKGNGFKKHLNTRMNTGAGERKERAHLNPDEKAHLKH